MAALPSCWEAAYSHCWRDVEECLRYEDGVSVFYGVRRRLVAVLDIHVGKLDERPGQQSYVAVEISVWSLNVIEALKAWRRSVNSHDPDLHLSYIKDHDSGHIVTF